MSKRIVVGKSDFSQNKLGTNEKNKNYLPQLKKGVFVSTYGYVVATVKDKNKIQIEYSGNGAADNLKLYLEGSASIDAGTYFGHTRNNKDFSGNEVASSIKINNNVLFSFSGEQNIRETTLAGTLTFDSIHISIPNGLSDISLEIQPSIEDVGYSTVWER